MNVLPIKWTGPVGAVVFASLLMIWPMVYNGFPIVYPDSMDYLKDGERIARALFLRQFDDYYGPRSPYYPLGIYPFHWNVTAWPVIWFQSVLVTYTLWVRNDDEEGVGNPDVDRRIIVRSEGRARDGLGFVALESVYSRSLDPAVQDLAYGQAGLSASGSNSSKADIN